MNRCAWATALGWLSMACSGSSTVVTDGLVSDGEGRSACAESSGAMLGDARLLVGPRVSSREIGRSFVAPGCEPARVVSMAYPEDNGRTGAWWLGVGSELSSCLSRVPAGALLDFDPVGQSVAPRDVAAWRVTGVCAVVHQNDWAENDDVLEGKIDDQWQFWGTRAE